MILQEKQLIPIRILPGLGSINEIIADLKNRGYQFKFRRDATGLTCVDLNRLITPDNFTVDEYYHFEDNTNTDRERSVYAVSSIDGLKGFLVDARFVYEDNISTELAQKLNWD